MMYHLILSSRGASAPERLLDELHRFLASNRECQKMRRQKIGGSGVGGGARSLQVWGVDFVFWVLLGVERLGSWLLSYSQDKE